MLLFLSIINAGMLAQATSKRFGLGDFYNGRLVLTVAWLALLGFFAFSFTVAVIVYPLLTVVLLLTGNWFGGRNTDKESGQWNVESMLWVGLCCTPLLLAFVYLYVPVVQVHDNHDLLSLVKNYNQELGIYFNPALAISGYPQLGYAIFGMNTPVSYPPGLTAWFYALLCLLLLFILAGHFTSRRMSFFATAAFACSPMFLHFASQPALAPIFCCFALGAANALLLYEKEPRKLWLVCAGVLCGAACGVYYLGYLLLALLAVALLLVSRNAKASGLFAGVALLLAAPWLLRVYLLTGNPAYPYFQQWFPTTLDGPYFAYFMLNPAASGGVFEAFGNAVRYPWELVMQPQNMAQWATSPGVFLVAFALPGFALGKTRLRLLTVFAVVGGLLAFAFGSGDVFVLAPFIALLCITAAASLERFPQGVRKPVFGVALVMVLTGLVMQAGMVYAERDVISGRVGKSEYLTRHIPQYPAYENINDHYNDGGAVLLSEPHTWHLEVPAIYNPWAVRRVMELPKAEQKAWLDGNKVGYMLLVDGETGRYLEPWRRDRSLFRLEESFDYPQREGGGVFRVRLYKRVSGQ